MQREHAACGVGFLANRHGVASHAIVQAALEAVKCVEHRGGFLADGVTSDGCGVMLDIPFELLGLERGAVAVATLLLLTPASRRRDALGVFEATFAASDLEVVDYRRVPVEREVLGPMAAETLPEILHAIIKRPHSCRTRASFEQKLYLARQRVRTTMKRAGMGRQFYFASLSSSTIVYKALTRSEDLGRFYLDLADPAFTSRFGVFHRRFSTNTHTAWDKVQPFRLIAHNGEINTIAGNHSAAYSREQAMGLPPDELLTHKHVSDSGALNGMVEALKHRSSMKHTEDVLAIMIPPAKRESGYYRFWSRAMEAWDGPAFLAYCDGDTIGARLDRNGFRPCRWAMTEDTFYVASEAGVFDLDERTVIAKGALRAGRAVRFDLRGGASAGPHFRDPSRSRENDGAAFDARLEPLPARAPFEGWALAKQQLFGFTKEERRKLVVPMIRDAREPIGSMGDTAALAVLSDQPRSFFDFFFQTFAQVTNPPLDYLRERLVTDLQVHLGKQPNIFAPTEMIPPMPGLALDSPILDSRGYGYLLELSRMAAPPLGRGTVELHTRFARADGVRGFRARVEALGKEALAAVRNGARILLITDRLADKDHPPVPALLALRSVVRALNAEGLRLECSLVVASGEVRTSHHVASLIAFGATAVCPVLPIEVARDDSTRAGRGLDADTREANLHEALRGGLLKVMSKMGISVVRSYRSTKLFSAVGLGRDVIEGYFQGLASPVGGLDMRRLGEWVLRATGSAHDDEGAPRESTFQFKEHAKLAKGERHGMTAERAALLHAALAAPDGSDEAREAYAAYRDHGSDAAIHVRDLLTLRPGTAPWPLHAVEDRSAITARFGAGAMSFGAISADTQRDLIVAMRAVGGRSNSGEGGENPHYHTDGTHASTKQVASARFGVTAQYLAACDEIEIKMAQGAKPGEGGQLMGVKVSPSIAKARHASPGVDLISPPPQHDIYSIEDLKQLIFELKQLHPDKPVCVKLVSGVNIGTIAAGVVKAGADVIQISGGSGGTGAAGLISMKHAGLPWELGLVEVHRTLAEQRLRRHVKLRVDGGLSTGRDIVIAAALGADEFGFGKLLLVAVGCVMARVCERNTCPRGIATQDPRYEAKYQGGPEMVVALMHHLADDVRAHLARMGVSRLADIVGRTHLLQRAPEHEMRMVERGIDLDALLEPANVREPIEGTAFARGTTPLNASLVDEARTQVAAGKPVVLTRQVRSLHRAVLARLAGTMADERHAAHLARLSGDAEAQAPLDAREGPIRVELTGSAGQGFGVFLVEGLDVTLRGEANDAVCKSMSGGRVVIAPHPDAALDRFDAEGSAIIGNAALYGATGGELFVRGRAGDRFAVRNSGALAVVEGVGLHACGYMTAGTVVVLGPMDRNVGAGMTGGELYCARDMAHQLHEGYVQAADLEPEQLAALRGHVQRYAELTGSATAKRLAALDDDALGEAFVRVAPRRTPKSLPLVVPPAPPSSARMPV